MPKHSYCPTGVEWFRSRGQWQDRNSIPVPGSIIYFDWGGDGIADHVGIVESCDGSTVYTIEGNPNEAAIMKANIFFFMIYNLLKCYIYTY